MGRKGNVFDTIAEAIDEELGSQAADILQNAKQVKAELANKKISKENAQEKLTELDMLANQFRVQRKKVDQALSKAQAKVEEKDEFSFKMAGVDNTPQGERFHEIFANMFEGISDMYKTGKPVDMHSRIDSETILQQTNSYKALLASRQTGRGEQLAAAADIAPANIAGAEVIEFFNGAVETLRRPLSLLNFVRILNTNKMTVRFPQEDISATSPDTKASEVAADMSRAAGTSFKKSDYHTELVTRDLVSTGHFMNIFEELMIDSEKNYAIPWLRQTAMNDLELFWENSILSGSGTAPVMTGIISEGGINTVTQLKTGDAVAELRPVINSFSQAKATVSSTAYIMPSVWIVHPNDLHRFRTLGSDTEGWFLQAPVRTDAPLVGSMPTLWGIPIMESVIMTERNFAGFSSMFTGVFVNGASIRTRQGYIGTNLLKNEITIIFDVYSAQFTMRPKATVKWDATKS